MEDSRLFAVERTIDQALSRCNTRHSSPLLGSHIKDWSTITSQLISNSTSKSFRLQLWRQLIENLSINATGTIIPHSRWVELVDALFFQYRGRKAVSHRYPSMPLDVLESVYGVVWEFGARYNWQYRWRDTPPFFRERFHSRLCKRITAHVGRVGFWRLSVVASPVQR
jgi:hypothetical protein